MSKVTFTYGESDLRNVARHEVMKTAEDGRYYEFTFDKGKKKAYLDTYGKEDSKIIDMKAKPGTRTIKLSSAIPPRLLDTV